MKPSALTLALLATVSLRATDPAPVAEPAAAAPPADLSAEVAQELNATLPKKGEPVSAAKLADIRQQSVERAPASQLEGTPTTPADPEVLELPKMTVKQQPKPRPRLNATDTKAVMLGPKAFNEELAKANLSALDRSVLNKFTIPSWLGGVSAADRAREDYNIAQKQQFLSDVSTIAKAAELTDPAAAKALRDAAAKP